MERFIETINDYLIRLGIGFIVACTIASPSINNFIQNAAWLFAGIIFFFLVMLSIVIGVQFSKKHKSFFIILTGLFISLVTYLFLRWGSQAGF